MTGTSDPAVRRGMDNAASRLRVLAGLGLAVVAIAAMLVWVGPETIAASILGAEPLPLLGALLVSASALGFRILALLVLYRRIATGVLGEFALVYLATGVPRNLLPGGDAAGTAIVAYALHRETKVDFEPALASLSVAELFNTVASFCVACAGAVLLVLSLPPGHPVPRFVAVVGVVSAMLVALTVAGLTRAESLTRGAFAVAAVLRRTLGRFPLTSHVRDLTAGRTAGRLSALRSGIEQVSTSTRAMWSSYALSATSWVGYSLPLALTAGAVGADVSVATVLLVVPIVSLAAVLPVPGGLGGVEIAGTGLLVLLAGLDPGTAAAATLLYRITTYWLEVALGVLAVGVMGGQPTAG